MKKKDYYSIGEVASICNISIRTLRYYDEIKLVVPEVRKEESKYRYYSKNQMIAVMIIRKLRALDMGIKDIKEIIDKNNAEVLQSVIEKRLGEIEEEKEKLESLLTEGRDFLHRIKDGNDILKKYKDTLHSDVKIEMMPEINMYYCRKMMKAYHNEEVSLERWVEINEDICKLGLKACGSVIVTYYAELFEQFLSKSCDVEFGIQVETGEEGKTRVFGGFEAATIHHVGPYREIVKTYVKALQWIHQNGYKVGGPISEEFLISPMDVENENNHVTKILIPVVEGELPTT